MIETFYAMKANDIGALHQLLIFDGMKQKGPTAQGKVEIRV